jgi:hypothetical protein
MRTVLHQLGRLDIDHVAGHSGHMTDRDAFLHAGDAVTARAQQSAE